MKIHYIDDNYYRKIWIVAKTECGIHWQQVDEYTSEIERVTCKKCLNKLKKK